ncbi:MAG: PIN domain-containing protein [Pseudomonadota bacterium]
MKSELRYWDSNCFLGWLKNEPSKASLCEGVIQGAEKGEFLIVTSALTLVEVVKLKHELPIPATDAIRVQKFFESPFIRVRGVDRFLAEKARELVWHYQFLKPKDAVHVATAIDREIRIFDTFDEDLIRLSGRLGNPPMRIGKPDRAYQLSLMDQIEETKEHAILFRKFEKMS